MTSAGAPTLLAVRARRLAGRRRWRRAFVAVVVALTAAVAAAQFQAAEAARGRWAATRVVAVAQRDLGPGEVVGDDTVELREVSSASVAPAALDVVPAGSVVRYPVAAGEPLVASRLAPDGLSGLAALVPAGDRAVAVPVGPAGRPPLRVGDRVDVLAVTGPADLLPLDPVPPPTGEPAVEGTPDPEADADAGPAPEGHAPDDGHDHGDGDASGHARGSDGGEGDGEASRPEAGAGRDEGGEGGGPEASASVPNGAAGDPPERPAGAPVAPPGVVPLVARALVVDVADEVVTVAVPSALAPAVAAAVTQGAVVLTLAST